MRQGRECIDDWLAQRNLWRKQVARDDISLYRAVSDQLFPIDGSPEKMRQQVEQYLRIHTHEFKSQITCRVEYLAMCKLYDCSIVIFRCNKAPVEVALEDAVRKVLLCINSSQRYDPVYPLVRRDHSAICQSIIYEMLYRNVFEVPNETIELGLEILRAKVSKKAKLQLLERMQKPGEEQMIRTDDGRLLPSHPPFPYRVAKALDASIFRNVQFDLWIDNMKENRDIPTFHVGDRCKVVLGSGIYNAHIQDIRTTTGPVQVFIQEFGERLDVPYDAMRPIPTPVQIPKRAKRNSGRSYSFHANTIFGSVTEQGSDDPVYSVAVFKSKPRQYLNSTGHPIRVRWSPTKDPRRFSRESDVTKGTPFYQVPMPSPEPEMKVMGDLPMERFQIPEPPPFYDQFMMPNPLAYSPSPEMMEQFTFPGLEYQEQYIQTMPNIGQELLPQNMMRPLAPPFGQPTYYCLPNPGLPMYYTAPEAQFYVVMPPEPVEFNPTVPPPVIQQVYLPA